MAETEEAPKNRGGRPKGKKDRKPRKKKWTPEGVRILKAVSPKARKKGLSPKHRLVVNEYFRNGFHKKKALEKVGYSKSVSDQYWNIFDRVDVDEEIQRRHRQREKRVEVTIDRVVEELAKIAFANPGKILLRLRENNWNLGCLSENELAVINELREEDFMIGRGEDASLGQKHSVKMLDKKGALVDLGKHMGMFQEKKTDTLAESIVDLLAAGRARFQQKKE